MFTLFGSKKAVSSLFLLLLVITESVGCASDAPEKVVPDERLQEHLRELAKVDEPGLSDDLARIAIVLDQVATDAEGQELLARQSMFFIASGPSLNQRRYLARMLGIARECDLFQVATATFVAGCYLDSPDPRYQKAAHWLLANSQGLNPTRAYDQDPVFARIRDHILRAQRGGESTLPDWLVAQMFDIDPDAALNTFTSVSVSFPLPALIAHVKRQQIQIETHRFMARHRLFDDGAPVYPPAVDAIKALAGNELRWARLYAAKIMAQHAELRNAAVVERLSIDSDVLVRQVAERIQADKSAERIKEAERKAYDEAIERFKPK